MTMGLLVAVALWLWKSDQMQRVTAANMSTPVAVTAPDGLTTILYVRGNLAIRISKWSRPENPGEGFMTTYSIVKAYHHGAPDFPWQTGEDTEEMVRDVLTIRECSNGVLFGTYRVSSDPLRNTEVLNWFVVTDSSSEPNSFETKDELVMFLKAKDLEEIDGEVPIAEYVEKRRSVKNRALQ
jgi:hypothetical protein